jgi:hypothetical protein
MENQHLHSSTVSQYSVTRNTHSRAHKSRYSRHLQSLYCVCFSAGAHRDTNTHTHTLKTQANTCQAMIENQHFHSSTVCQYSATRNTNTHWSDESPAKTPDGRADNWLLFKKRYLYRGETESYATSCKVDSENQTKTKKEHIYTYTHTQVCMLVCMIVWGARANHS